MIKSKGLGQKHRKITITLNEAQENLIENIKNKIKKNGGYRLGRTEVIRASVKLIGFLKLDEKLLSGIKDEDDLFEVMKKRLSVMAGK